MTSRNQFSSYNFRPSILGKKYTLPVRVNDHTKNFEGYSKTGKQVGVQSTFSPDGNSCQAAKQSHNDRYFVCSRCQNTEEIQFPKHQHESVQDCEKDNPDKEVKTSKSQIEQLQKKIDTLLNELQSVHEENATLNKDKQSYEGTIYNLEYKLQEERDAIGDQMMQQMKEDFEEREVNYVKQIRNLEQEVKEVNEKKTDLDKGLHTDDCELKKDHLREEIKTLTEKNEELQKASELHLLKTRNEQYENTIGLLSEKNEQLQKIGESLKRDKERMKCEHKQQVADLRSHISMLTSRNSKLEEEQGVSKTRMEAMEKEAKEEKLQTLDLHKQKEEEIKLLGMNLEQITKLSSDVEGQKGEIKSLATQVSTLAEEKTKLTLELTKEKEENKDKVETLEAERTKLSSELEHRKKNKEQLQEKVETLEVERTQLSSEIENHRKNSEQYQGEVKTLEKERTKLSSELEHRKKNTEQLQVEVKTLEVERTILSSELEHHKKNNKQFKENVETLEAERTKLSSEIENHKKDNEQLQEKVETLEAERTKLSSELENHKKDNEQLQEKVETLEAECTKLSSDLEHHRKKNEQLQEDVELERTKIISKLENHKKVNDDLKHRIFEEEIKHLQDEIQELKKPKKKDVVEKPKLLDKHWRLEPRFDREYLQSVQREIEQYWPLRDQGVAEDTLQHVNILFIGPVGVGKSSFINTVDSSLRGHVTATAGAGNRDQSFTSAVRKYPIYASDNRRQLKFQLCDCRGLEDGVDITQDIESILEGHIPNNYVINTASPLKENIHGYNQHPGLEDKIHCVVYVLNAGKHSDHADIHTPFTTKDVRNQIENIQTHVYQKGIPQLILLNKVDIVCQSTMYTTSDVYRSSLVRQRCIDAAEFLGLPPMTVLPMRNYFMETSTTDDIGILALYNIQRMLRESDTFLRVNHLEELRSDKYEPQ